MDWIFYIEFRQIIVKTTEIQEWDSEQIEALRNNEEREEKKNNCKTTGKKKVKLISQLENKLWINFPTTLMLLEEICVCSPSQRNMS